MPAKRDRGLFRPSISGDVPDSVVAAMVTFRDAMGPELAAERFNDRALVALRYDASVQAVAASPPSGTSRCGECCYLPERGAYELWGFDLSPVQVAFAEETLRSFAERVRLIASHMELNPAYR
jgi:hypothetical protein